MGTTTDSLCRRFSPLRRSNLLLYAYLLGMVLSIFPAMAQTTIAEFEHLSLDEGLSQSFANNILQDHRGFLWIATADGLNRYDGTAFKVYQHTPGDTTSLSDNRISFLFEDGYDNLWVGTHSGLNRLSDTHNGFIRYPVRGEGSTEGLSHPLVNAIVELEDGSLLIGTYGGGIDKLDPATGRFTPLLKNYPAGADSSVLKKITSLVLDNTNMLWAGTAGGVMKIDPVSVSATLYRPISGDKTSLSHHFVNAVYCDHDGNIWIGTDFGLNLYDPEADNFIHYFSNPDSEHSLSSNTIFSIYQDRNDKLWIGTANGLNRLNLENHFVTRLFHDPYDKNSLSNNKIMAIYEDRGGVLWFGTQGGGLNKFDPNRRKFYHFRNTPDAPEGFHVNRVYALAQRHPREVWIGTTNGLIHLKNRSRSHKRAFYYKPTSGKFKDHNKNFIRSLCFGNERELWVGRQDNGLLIFDLVDKKFRDFRFRNQDAPDLSKKMIYEIRADKGFFWISTSEGLIKMDSSKTIHAIYSDSGREPGYNLSSSRVLISRFDARGNLWLGTYQGVNVIEAGSGKVRSYRPVPGDTTRISNRIITAIYPQNDSTVWVGTYGGGLNRLNPYTGRVKLYDERHGLPNKVVYAILPDSAGNLWMSTNKGVSKFTPETESFRNFDTDDGLQSHEFNTGAAFHAPDGRIFFGGINGFNAFYPSQIKKNPLVPPIVLTGLTIFNKDKFLEKDFSEIEELRLSHKEYVFSLKFAALSFTNPHKNSYAYKLKPFHKKWIYIGNKHEATFTNLNPGEYQFRIKAANSDGVWNQRGLTLRLVITPPFWLEPWFMFFSGLVLVLSIYGAHRLRLAQIKKRNQELFNINLKLNNEILEREKAEKALQLSEARKSAMLESALDSIISIDANGTVLEFNPAAERTFGYTREQALGRTIDELIIPEYLRKKHKAGLKKQLETGESKILGKRIELPALRSDGTEITIEITVQKNELNDKVIFTAFIRDITELRKAEAEKERLKAQIQQTQKLESLGVLAGGIAHDFNNLLTGILGNASLAQLEIPENSPVVGSLCDIEKAAQRAAELCRQMLAYAGKGRFVIKPVNLNALVEELSQLLEVSISKKVTLHYNFHENLPSIQADETQIRQVVMNLITNASDAIGDEPGMISLKTGSMFCSTDYLSSSYLSEELPEGEYVFLEVSDTGCGMDEETMKKIFDPFFTTKFTGRGLGLAAVLGIIRSHKGAVRIESTPGKGTRFEILFPAGETPSQAIDNGQQDKGQIATWKTQGQVLIIDDEDAVRTVGVRILKKIGFSVDEARNGREGLELFKANADKYRMVLLDMTMPELDGEGTYKEMIQIKDDVRVIFSSGYSKNPSLTRMMHQDTTRFIQKPYLPEELANVVRELLDE